MAARLSLILGVVTLACTPPGPPVSGQRVISLSPAATSMVIALEASEQLVGISTFCPPVPHRKGLPRLGGFIDPNLEAIAALQPSLVLLTEGGKKAAQDLERLGIKSLRLAETDLQGVVGNYERLGAALNRKQAATELKSELETLLQAGPHRGSKRTLLVFAHESARYWLATKKGWLGQLAERLGIHVIPEGNKGFEPISAEGILSLKPDQILELRGQPPGQSSLVELRAKWARFPALIAPASIHLIEDDQLLQPGDSLRRTARLLRPFGARQ